MKTKILLIFVLFTISLFGQFKANKDGFLMEMEMEMESEEDKNVICQFALMYNKKEHFDMCILIRVDSIGLNSEESDEPTKIYFSTFNGNLSIPLENNRNKGVVVVSSASHYMEAEGYKYNRNTMIGFYDDVIIKQILYLLAANNDAIIQIYYTKDSFYSFNFSKYNEKKLMNEN